MILLFLALFAVYPTEIDVEGSMGEKVSFLLTLHGNATLHLFSNNSLLVNQTIAVSGYEQKSIHGTLIGKEHTHLLIYENTSSPVAAAILIPVHITIEKQRWHTRIWITIQKFIARIFGRSSRADVNNQPR